MSDVLFILVSKFVAKCLICSVLVSYTFIQLSKLKSELGELHNNPQGLLLEAIHSSGYSGALANPLLAPESALNILDGPVLEEFIAVRSMNLVNIAYILHPCMKSLCIPM